MQVKAECQEYLKEAVDKQKSLQVCQLHLTAAQVRLIIRTKNNIYDNFNLLIISAIDIAIIVILLIYCISILFFE